MKHYHGISIFCCWEPPSRHLNLLLLGATITASQSFVAGSHHHGISIFCCWEPPSRHLNLLLLGATITASQSFVAGSHHHGISIFCCWEPPSRYLNRDRLVPDVIDTNVNPKCPSPQLTLDCTRIYTLCLRR